MRTRGGTAATRVLFAFAAVLLVAGVLSTTVVDRQPSTSGGVDRRVGAVGLDGSVLVEESTTTSAAPVTVAQKPVTTVPAAPAATTSTRPPSFTSTTTGKAVTSTTVPLTDPNWLTVPNIVPSARWQTDANGVSMRLRIEPAVPVAGQTVRFFMEVSGPGLCCMVGLTFGEGSNHFQVNSSVSCTPAPAPTPGPHSYVTTHTYASPGAYKARMVAVGGDMCGTSPHDPRDLHWIPLVSGNPIKACIAVGPGPAGDGGCPTNDN